MEPKVKIDHGRELDELTKFTKKFLMIFRNITRIKKILPMKLT